MPVIAHNLSSQFTNRQLNIATNSKTKATEKLSSGYKINKAAVGAVNLKMLENMQSANDTNIQLERNAIDNEILNQANQAKHIR